MKHCKKTKVINNRYRRRRDTNNKNRKYLLVERTPKLAFTCNQADDYPNCHHITFNQQLKKADREIYSKALGLAT